MTGKEPHIIQLISQYLLYTFCQKKSIFILSQYLSSKSWQKFSHQKDKELKEEIGKSEYNPKKSQINIV